MGQKLGSKICLEVLFTLQNNILIYLKYLSISIPKNDFSCLIELIQIKKLGKSLI